MSELEKAAHESAKLRRVFIVAAALYAMTRGVAYLLPRPTQGPIWDAALNGGLIPVWGAVWVIAGAWALFGVRAATINPGVFLTVGLMYAWGAMWGLGWLFAVAEGDLSTFWWQTMATYIGPAVMVTALLGVMPRR